MDDTNSHMRVHTYKFVCNRPITYDLVFTNWYSSYLSRRFGESLANQTGGKRVVSTNDGRTSTAFWQVFGESNWREEGSQYQ
jgi:hypothetical protein